MPSSSWPSNDRNAVPIHLKLHQESISTNCSSIKIDPMPIRHSLSRPILPVTQKLCEGMSVFGWINKCQSISRSVSETQTCFMIKLCASTGMPLLDTSTMRKEVHQKTWELPSCLSVWVWSYDVQKQFFIFESFTCIFMWSSSVAWRVRVCVTKQHIHGIITRSKVDH